VYELRAPLLASLCVCVCACAALTWWKEGGCKYMN
jgi:hypothetical protein